MTMYINLEDPTVCPLLNAGKYCDHVKTKKGWPRVCLNEKQIVRERIGKNPAFPSWCPLSQHNVILRQYKKSGCNPV